MLGGHFFVMVNVLIIDDDNESLRKLTLYLNRYRTVNVVGSCSDINQGLMKLQIKSVNLIFVASKWRFIVDRKQREKRKEQEVKLIELTDDYVETSLLCKTIPYCLKKPVIEGEINQIITTYLRVKDEDKIEVSFLGAFHIQVNGKEIQWDDPKEKELCAYFFHQHSIVPLATILKDVWSFLPAHIAKSYFFQYVASLQRKFHECGSQYEHFQCIEGPMIWGEANIFCDIDQVAYLAQQVVNKPIELLRNRIEHVCSLYRGHYLEDENYQWATTRRDIVKSQYLFLLQQIGFYYYAEQDWEKSILWLKKMVLEDPTFEEASSKIMNAYLELGKKVDALKFYIQLKRQLQLNGQEPPYKS